MRWLCIRNHIVGHMFLISYRPNWRWLGMRETAAKSFVDEVEAAWSEYAEGMSGEIDVEENARSRNLSVKVWAFMRLTAKSLCSRSGYGNHAVIPYAF